MTVRIGDSLGRYHILEQLGEGGMATVYKAFDTRLEREVAVKAIRTDLFGHTVLQRVLKRFEREAKALAKLSHPNIVGVLNYGEHDGAPFLVMQYVPGGTLKGRLGRPVRWPDAIRLILPIARALDYAHNHGIVHRDVKPSNILLTDTGEPMLTDFGIAKVLESGEGQTLSTTTGVGIGTPEYMAPEQGLGQEVDARADVYSLGIVLYELITGRKPFQADTPMAVIVKHIKDPLPRPRQFARDVPDAVERALFKALAKRPGDRYRSMAEFERALERLSDSVRKKEETIVQKQAQTSRQQELKRAASTSPEPDRRRSPRQNRSLFSIAGTVAILLASIGFIVMGNPEQRHLWFSLFPASTATPTATFTPTNTPQPTATKTTTPSPTADPIVDSLYDVFDSLGTTKPVYAVDYSRWFLYLEDVPSETAWLSGGSLIVRSHSRSDNPGDNWRGVEFPVLQSSYFAIQTDLRFVESKSTEGHCSVETKNSYYNLNDLHRLMFSFYRIGRAGLVRNRFSFEPDSFEAIADGQSHYGFNDFHMATVIVLGPRLSAFVDGELAYTVLDEEIDYSVYTLSANFGAVCEYDNLKVWDLRGLAP